MKTWEEMRGAVNAGEGSVEHRILADIEKGVAAATPFTVQRATYGGAAASNLQIWEVVGRRCKGLAAFKGPVSGST